VSAPRFGVADLAEFSARLAELRADLGAPTAPGQFVAHTDGACFGNPEGPGGWAAVVENGGEWLLWGHLSSTSNNRAEALGVLAALEWLPADSSLEVHSDSELTVRVLRRIYKARANADIWTLIWSIIDNKRLRVEATWLRGHAGDPRNELADRLSKLGASNGRVLDQGGRSMPRAPAPPPATPPELVGLEPRGEWERAFLASVADQLRRRRPLSAKQQAIIDRIRSHSPSS
jgi:ribonuclease HI